MTDSFDRRRERLNGRAVFVAAAFLTATGLIFVLERVGAPEGLARALTPLVGLASVGLIGALARSQRLPQFLAADRSLPPLYGGLAFAAAGAGLWLDLDPALSGASPVPGAGVALGLLLGALFVGPLVRRSGASTTSDLLATNYPGPIVVWTQAGALWLVGMLLALAGVETAVALLTGQLGMTRGPAAFVVALVLALATAPGGLSSLLWCSAACGGAAMVATGLGLTGHFISADDALARVTAFDWTAAGGGAPALSILASALGVAALAIFTPVAVASVSVREARRAGFAGLVFLAGLFVAAPIVGLTSPHDLSPASAGLKLCALLLASIALAAGGAFGAGRALGSSATRQASPFPVLASQKLARIRIAMLVAIALAAGLAAQRGLDAKALLLIAVALSLAFVAPLLALALTAQVSKAQAAAAMVASVVVLLALGAFTGAPPPPDRLLADALSAAAASFAIGWFAGRAAPPSAAAPQTPHDLLIEPPLEGDD